MPVDLSTLERLLLVIALCLVVQTAALVAALVAAWRAYREASAMAERELRELRARTDEIAATVQKTADAVARGTQTVTSALDDARRAMGTAGTWVASAAGTVASPRSAMVVGLLRGLHWWRQRRAARRPGPDDLPPGLGSGAVGSADAR